MVRIQKARDVFLDICVLEFLKMIPIVAALVLPDGEDDVDVDVDEEMRMEEKA